MSTLIESPHFPINEVNEFSASEKRGGGRPDFWEMVFWWTRKPLIGARSVIAGALVPSDFSPFEFRRLVKLWPETRSPHRENPSIVPRLKERLPKVKLLDPFAGFGSIPLEAVRLSVGEVVAVELLPTAYVFLKAVLEYPREHGKRLVKDVERWGEWVLERLREDPDVKELYDEDVAVYIGSWEVKCPHCGRYTPLVGNWWLARVPERAGRAEEAEGEGEGEGEGEEVRSGAFRRLAWMAPYTSSSAVGIRVVDLNKELGLRGVRANVNARQGRVEASGRVYDVPRPNVDARRETATCLLCNNAIRGAGRGWYVKEALKEYNEDLERYLRGEMTREDLLKSRARPRILVKVKIVDKELEFEPATSEDGEKLWKALEKLRGMWGDPDIPTEPLAEYENRAIWVLLYNFDKFFKLFNPRQLIILVKLVKLVREVGKKIEEEKLKEGWIREDAHRYAGAVTTYLAMALVHFADYNSIVTAWHPGFWGLMKVVHTITFRGIAMTWNWSDVNPITCPSISYPDMIKGYIVRGLSYLVSAISGSPSRVRVLLDDATSLSKLEGERFDLVVTDPPYRDDVPYAELSDFYYVWLKRALSDVEESFGVMRLAPRFHKEAFFDDLGNEIEAQWKAFALREVSESERRIRHFDVEGNAFNHFKSLLSESFKAMASKLEDDGSLVTYYAHTSPEAWEALLEAGWLSGKMRVTAAHAMATESAESVLARGKVRLDMSIVAVWRKGVKGEALVDEVYAKAVEACSKDAQEYRKAGLEGVNLFVAVLGKVLSHFTQYERLIGLKATNKPFVQNLVENYIYPATAEAIARSYGAARARLSPPSMFYLLSKVLVNRRPRQARRVLDRTSATVLSIGTRSYLEGLGDQRIVQREGDSYVLLEPRWGARDLRDAIWDALTVKELNPREPRVRTAIDVLHLLEFYATTLPKEEFKRRADELRGRRPGLFDEAMALARALASGLPAEDPERELAKNVVEALEPAGLGTLDSFIRR